MTTLTPTKADGATTKAGDVVCVESDRQVSHEQLASILPDFGLNTRSSSTSSAPC